MKSLILIVVLIFSSFTVYAEEVKPVKHEFKIEKGVDKKEKEEDKSIYYGCLHISVLNFLWIFLLI